GPISPPNASTSRTTWPLAMPPTAGLQDICPIFAGSIVIIMVLSPMRAGANAASMAACPAPMTITSNFSGWICFMVFILVIPAKAGETKCRILFLFLYLQQKNSPCDKEYEQRSDSRTKAPYLIDDAENKGTHQRR